MPSSPVASENISPAKLSTGIAPQISLEIVDISAICRAFLRILSVTVKLFIMLKYQNFYIKLI